METAKQGMTERENTHRVLRRPLSSGLKAVKQTHICQNNEPLLSKSGNPSRKEIFGLHRRGPLIIIVWV